MHCVMTNGLYLRASGRLPCYCGAGETVTLGRVPAAGDGRDFVRDVFAGGLFAEIRRKQALGLTPFPGVCELCPYLDLDSPDPHGSDASGHPVLAWFHWEPTSRCNLDCEWCRGQRPVLPEGGPARDMPRETFDAVVESLGAAGYRLGKGNICGVGEPTLNRDIWRMIARTRELLGGHILMSTNGNGPFSPEIATCGLDAVKIAVDAVDQESYQRYRKGGRLEKVLDFSSRTAGAKAALRGNMPEIIWQYILFNHNDSDRELLAMQRMARESGVDKLRIVYTRCDNYSARTPEDFPRDFPDIDFFPIKEDSLATPAQAESALRDCLELAARGEPRQASLQAIRAVAGAFRRFMLGVKTYKDLVAAVGKTPHLAHANPNALSREDFLSMKSSVAGLVDFLGRTCRDMGHAEQARGYARFANTLRGEQS